MTQPRQVICMKWGTLYGADYVNLLYGMVRSQTKGDLRFVCLTDDAEGVHPEVECLDCPEVDIEPPYHNYPWRKLALWAAPENLHGLTGNWLFLDLDVVVTGGIDAFFEYQPEKMFVVMQNWTQKGQGIGNTSVFRFRVGCATHLQENLGQRFNGLLEKYRNEQIYISHEIEEVTFWPDEWCLLYKIHCVPAWPLNFFLPPKLPEGARVVAFPGSPNPHEALVGEWPVTQAWKGLYKHTRPARWIGEAWNRAAEAGKV